MKTTTYQLETVSCPSCIAKIEGMLKRTPGVSAPEVMFNSSRVRLDFDEKAIGSEEIKRRIEGLGYKVLGEK